jgi:hypothetical protein
MENESKRSCHAPQDEPARLIHANCVRVLNCSADGCLLETTRPVPMNSVVTLHVSFGGKMFEDVVQAVRCVGLSDGSELHHVAARFLSVAPPYAGSLQYVIRKQTCALTGWLDECVEE